MALRYVLAHARRGRRGLRALEAVEEADCVIALWVAASITKVLPARYRGCAVLPRAEPVQSAVSSVPVALCVFTLWVTHPVATAFPTLHVRAGRSPVSDLAVLSAVASQAVAKERVGFVRTFHAYAAVLARAGWILVFAQRTGEAKWADALRLAEGGQPAPSAVLTSQVGTSVDLDITAVRTRMALRDIVVKMFTD